MLLVVRRRNAAFEKPSLSGNKQISCRRYNSIFSKKKMMKDTICVKLLDNIVCAVTWSCNAARVPVATNKAGFWPPRAHVAPLLASAKLRIMHLFRASNPGPPSPLKKTDPLGPHSLSLGPTKVGYSATQIPLIQIVIMDFSYRLYWQIKNSSLPSVETRMPSCTKASCNKISLGLNLRPV